MAKVCSVSGCALPHYGKTFCKSHYARVYRKGTTEGVGTPIRHFRRGGCSVAGCSRASRRNGKCNGHAARDRHALGVAPDAPLRGKAKRGEGHVAANGYRTLYVNGRNVGEHRVLAERFLGRPLASYEEVHHRNGQRAENTIGPCFMSHKCECDGGVRHNLEFWESSQPPGQRVSDKLQWARELIDTYEQDEIDRECDAFANGLQRRPANDVVAQAA